MPDYETVTINRNAYEELVRSDAQFQVLINMLFNAADLSYDGTDLYFHNVENVLWAISPERCRCKLNQLQNEKKQKEE
jgi:hypothetical protein